MWHEARKQEKLIRGMIVDYRRRAERRKDFYEKIKADPTQFLQLHGRPCKIHLDPAVAAAGEGPAIMMQWQGDPDNMIDRFDVRAHLDFIVEKKYPDIPIEDQSQEERHCNYERYRILAQNAFLGINEDKFLQQLAIEEQFGVTFEEKESHREKLHEKKGIGAAIGYNYNDPGAQPSSSSNGSELKKNEQEKKESDEDSDLEILDVDLSIDVNKMEPSQAHDLNAVGPLFGMAGCDLFSFMTGDADDAEHQKQLLREEKEKAMYSGRKSRRERRAHRDKKLASRVASPPSYAAPRPQAPERRSASPPPSPRDSAEQHAHIQFITSFGQDDDDDTPQSRPLYSEKVKQNLKRMELYSEVTRKTKTRSETSEDNYSRPIGPRGPNSRSVSPTTLSLESPLRSKRSPYRRSKSRSRSIDSYRSRSRSIDSYRRRSRSRSRSPSRSRSRSRNYRSRRSRSPNNSAKRNKSRSMSFESLDRSGPSKPVPRYYGRRKEDKSSSELSLDSDSSENDANKNKSSVGTKSNTNPSQLRSSGSGPKGASREGISHKDKLKKKMQAQLARQLRADKRAEAARAEREARRQARRDEEMRDLAIKLRRKQREMRHKYMRSSDESDRSRSRSSSRDSGPPGTSDKLRSRSRSKSPTKRPQVWDIEPPVNPKEPSKHRYQEPNTNFFPENNIRSRSPSPKQNYPVWENQRHYPPPDARRNYQERKDYHRFEPNNYSNEYDRPFENRWDSRRRPFRGGYRGQGRPGPSQGPPNWSRDQDDNDQKVKLVDY